MSAGFTPDADAIVVLGCKLCADGRPSPALARRVAAGIACHANGRAAWLVLSGGGPESSSEAEAMARLARQTMSAEAILLETEARNTVENALFCARLLLPRNLRRIVLVTDRYHLPRAAMAFRTAGFLVVGRVAPPRALIADAAMWLREAAALPLSLWRLRQLLTAPAVKPDTM